MLTPSTLTISQTGSGVTVVSTTLLSGTAQLLTLTVSNLPNSAVGIFAPDKVMVGQDSPLTITTKEAPVGTFPVTITATGPVSTHSAILTLIITPSDFSI